MSLEIKLPVTQLQEGMYIVDLEGKEGVDASVYSIEGFVLSDREIGKFIDSGYTYAIVDPSRSRITRKNPAPGVSLSEFDLIEPQGDDKKQKTPQAPQTEYYDELKKATSLRNAGMEVARNVALNASKEVEIPIEETRKLFTGLVTSIKANPNVLLGMGRLKMQDDYTFSHCMNVSVLAVALGKEMHLREDVLPDLAMAGFLYDIGKLFIRQDLLQYPGKLSHEQIMEVRSHVQRGYDYLKPQTDLPQMVFDGVADHQERYAGIGYPYGKSGLDISFVGRLLAVADVYDALSSNRCYKQALSPAQALSLMYSQREQDFSPGFVETLIATLGVYPPGSYVMLSTRQTAVVIETNPGIPLRPKVVLLVDAKGIRMRPRIIDLKVMLNVSIVSPVSRLPININVEDAIRSLG